ncbi:MAG: hypothetical protein CMJ78_17060 [Planctomycetaceae bacterium]|nr:hypothetical protein [Planctomycetaceae bacterium]
MQKQPKIYRRTMLRGSGALLALPYLEAMMPASTLALPQPQLTPRMGIFYLGMGMNVRQFFPNDFGPNFTTTRILKPLEEHRGDFAVLSGTYLTDGGGHKGTYCFTTGIEREKKQAISFDQIVADAIGKDTRFPSLQMSIERGTGFSGADLAILAWNRQGVPLPAQNDPTVLFDRLFRPPTAEQKLRQSTDFRQRKSVLDLVREDAARLNKKLGKTDQQQLDQYFNSVRELERELERQVQWSSKSKPNPELEGIGDYATPTETFGSGARTNFTRGITLS